MAKLHSISVANSARCFSFISACASLRGDFARQLLLRQRRHRAVRLHARADSRGAIEQVRAAGLGHRRQHLCM
jgi:hypothetical protein